MASFNISSAKIEDYVELMAGKSRIRAFYPQTVSRKLNIPTDIVLLELYKLVDKGKLELKYEIRCLIDSNMIDTVSDYKEIINKTMFCEICGKDIEVEYNNIYPIFYFNKEYREYIKKN